MVRSFAVIVVALAWVAAPGCGDDSGTSSEPATTSAPITGPSTFGTATSRGTGFEVSLQVTPDPPRAHQEATWRMVVSNTSDEPITLEFSSAKRGDVALLRGEREVWRWSDGRVFAQEFRREILDPGGSLMFDTTAPLEVEPGDYEVTATLVANLEAPPMSKAIRVEA